MSNNIIGPSTSLMDMDKIAEELVVVHGFVTSKDDSTKAADVIKVAEIEAEKIAVAATDIDGNLISGRGTVDNALKLGGKSAGDYFTNEEGEALESVASYLTSNTQDQVSDILDELYQLKNTLIRAGICKTEENFKGFCETFINETNGFANNKYTLDSQPTSGLVNSLKLASSYQDFSEGEYLIALVYDSNSNISNRYLTKVVGAPAPDLGIEPITVNPGETVEVYKFLGERRRGTFSFSKETSNTITNVSKITLMNDDKYSKGFVINKPNMGYAMTTFIPSTLVGALNKLVLKAKILGAPGDLTCYVIKETDINTFKSIAAAKVENKILATSDPVPSTGVASFTDISFNFNPVSSNFLSLDTDLKYCFIFECANASATNTWEILMSTNGSSGVPSDIKTNVGLYKWEIVPVAGTDDAFTQDLELKAYDLYYSLNTLEVAPLVETPYTVGLYTISKQFKEKEYGNKIRASLVIAKEGDTKVSSSSQNYPIGTSITTSSTVSAIDSLIRDDTVIIGKSINTIESVSAGNIVLQNAQDIIKDSNVYRIGYKVQAFVRMIDTDNDNEVSFIRVDLPLVDIKPYNELEGFSDRLIYEIELEKGTNKVATDIELQISWFTRKSEGEILNNQSLIGRIGTIDVSMTKIV